MKNIRTKVIFKGIAIMAFTFFGTQVIAQENFERGERPHPKERPSFEQILNDLDGNKDGKIAKSEAKGPLAHHFSKVDVNSDGYITAEEFAKVPEHPKKRPTWDEALSKLDGNKDGKIAEAEAKGPLGNHFSKVDANTDGFISKEEFKKIPPRSKKGNKKECKKDCKKECTKEKE